MRRTIISYSVRETRKLAQRLAQKPPGHIFALVGELGSGKTTFVQGFIKALGVRGRIMSPTFLIIRNYELGIRNYEKAYHIDCYRIKQPKELLKLGLKEILTNRKNIVLIEWAEKIKNYLPQKAVWIYFEHGKVANNRRIIVK